eukprot:TRINITY_DN444_c0_g1_i1.p1 TRINITY_DN444_c0_g1~~TRINITY_DN444_c0_g1_i1.p1  ORF type:complete len:218 (-),score=15.79 TRINITY_DN444_c0_g1_i1:8-661(-)
MEANDAPLGAAEPLTGGDDHATQLANMEIQNTDEKTKNPTSSLPNSDTHPIFADFIQDLPCGRLGITLCPGKHQKHKWERNLDQDLQRLQQLYNPTALVTLLQERDMNRLQVVPLCSCTEALGIESIHCPLQNGCGPTDLELWSQQVMRVVQLLQEDKCVVVHCNGGLGRSGCFCLCVLKALGISVDEALKMIKKVRPKSGGNTAQVKAAKQWQVPA